MPATILFDVIRTGSDLSRPVSVDWALEGDLVPADLATGQAATGRVSWAANETAAKLVTIQTKGNTVDNPDRICQIRLSNPLPATDAILGTAVASTTIVDDDAAVVLDYIQDLPYGGLLLGAAIQDGGPGNNAIRYATPNNAVLMYLEHMDPITAVQTENRLDHFPLGSSAGGYSDKTVMDDGSGGFRPPVKGETDASKIVARPRGGDLRWRAVRIVGPADGATGDLVPEKNTDGSIKWAGSTRTIVACGKDASWQREWEEASLPNTNPGTVSPAFSGTRNGGGYPTIFFNPPIDPVTMKWAIGDRIAFCIDNLRDDDGYTGTLGIGGLGMQAPYHTPPAHYMSLNNGHRNSRPLRKSTYKYLQYSGVYMTGFNYSSSNQRYAPVLLIAHKGTDGVQHVKGNAYTGAISGINNVPDFNIPFTRMRQIIYIPNDSRWTGRKIIGFDAGIWRDSTSIGGSVTLRLSRAKAGSVGAASDDGTLMGVQAIAAANIEVGGGRDGAATAFPQRSMTSFVVNAVQTVKAGEAYYLELEADNNGFTIGWLLNYCGRSVRGLMKCDHQDLNNKFQTYANGSWSNFAGQTDPTNYHMLGVSLHLRA